MIPARHFCHVFADRVHRICSNPATMPNAIAVELGPQTVATALSWLVELGVGTPDFRLFPVMLALVKGNRTIRASLREKAFRLQHESGKDISWLLLRYSILRLVNWQMDFGKVVNWLPSRSSL